MNAIELANKVWGYTEWNEKAAAKLNEYAALIRAGVLDEAKMACDEICQKAMDSGYTTKGATFIDGFGDGACACSCAVKGLK